MESLNAYLPANRLQLTAGAPPCYLCAEFCSLQRGTSYLAESFLIRPRRRLYKAMVTNVRLSLLKNTLYASIVNANSICAGKARGLCSKTDFTPVEAFRKYLWYILRERKFDEATVDDVLYLKAVLALTDEQVHCISFTAQSWLKV